MSTQPVSVYNVPNALTTARFGLAIAVMALIPYGCYLTALVVFLIAASTDWMDGYWARKYGQVTKLGRIFDPFVDKIIICGTFIALVAVDDSGVAAWMATVVVGRELLVTSLRGMIEGAGGDFSASQLGKWKMVLQCAAVVSVLLCLINQPAATWLLWTSQVLLWGTILLTVYSGYDYAVQTLSYIRSQIIEQKFYEIAIADYVPVEVGEGSWSEEIVQNLTFNNTGSFFDGDVTNQDQTARLAQVNAGLDPIRMRTQIWAKAAGWSIMEIERAAQAANWDVVESKLRSLKKSWDLGVQEVAFLGHPDGEITGLL
ncbi:MAG: CDP-diacylglycerol--glycerol-3-phosphate 3-phosphatidyltransferase, partial [Pirellulales bacterium]|nr:CDP-diacylglycerol--glycerol-3-phosphate 3-phosphatidyltransferase [Pirellulales bacterium]